MDYPAMTTTRRGPTGADRGPTGADWDYLI